MSTDSPRWADFESGDALDLADWPDVAGIPVLVPDAETFVMRHGPRGACDTAWTTIPHEPLPVDAPDPLTPHLAPAEWPASLRPPGVFGRWLSEVGGRCPDSICSDWGDAFAPEGLALDAGCGVGGMARRMAALGRRVQAFDRSPSAVVLARALLDGRLSTIDVPGARRSAVQVTWPHPPVASGQVVWAIADVLQPPVAPESIAWVHLGNVLDMVSASPAEVIDAVAPCIASGGVLTLSTPYDEDAVPLPHAEAPSDRLHEALDSLGFHVIAEERAVPWVVRQYDRGYRVLLTDCLAARVSW